MTKKGSLFCYLFQCLTVFKTKTKKKNRIARSLNRLIASTSSQWGGRAERGGGGGGPPPRQSIFISLHNQTESVKNNNEPIWVMFRELKKILL